MTNHVHNHRAAIDCNKFCPQWLELFRHGDTNSFVDDVTHEDVRDGALGDVIDKRVKVYGEVIPAFTDIAKVWSGICGFEIQPSTVPLMMVGMKAVRARVMPEYSDNSDDIDGYMDIFRTLVGEDMIHARTVNDFIAQRWPS